MQLRIQKHPKIITRDNDKKENGFLVPIFNIHDNFIDPTHLPKQVYLTVVSPGTIKGPHLHMKRCGFFTCIKGNVKIVIRIDGRYEEYFTGEKYEFASIEVPAGTPAAIQNIGSIDAYVLNMPCPAWHVNDQDEHPVENWEYDFRSSLAATQSRSVMNENEVGTIILDAAIYIHKQLGPGLLESVYDAILAKEIEKRGLKVKTQVPVAVEFDSLRFDIGFRADIIVEDKVILELKSVEAVIPAHKKQIQTYLKLTGLKLGYLLNFGEAYMKDGIIRAVNGLKE